MFSLNKVQIIGYITQPVELRQTPGGQSVADINVAVPYRFQGQDGQELEGTGYHSVTAWAGMADVAAQYLRPGSQVYLSGRLQTDNWEDQQSGEKRSKTSMVAMDLIMLDPRDGQLEPPQGAKELTQCLNRADLVGNVTKDPEMRTTTNGHHVLTLGVATNERWRDKSSGETRERTEFHNVVVWRDRAKQCADYLKKGNRIHVSGRVQTRGWETKSGSKRTTTETIADSISLLGVKNTDIAYTDKTREERFGTSAPSDSSHDKKAEQPKEPAAVAAGNIDIPDIQYESDVKAENLPF